MFGVLQLARASAARPRLPLERPAPRLRAQLLACAPSAPPARPTRARLPARLCLPPACAPYALQPTCPAPGRGPVTVLQYSTGLPQSQYSFCIATQSNPLPANIAIQFCPPSMPQSQLYCNTIANPSSLLQYNFTIQNGQ